MADYTPGSPTSVAQNQLVNKLSPPTFNVSGFASSADNSVSAGLSTLGLSSGSTFTTAGIVNSTGLNQVSTSSVSDTTTAVVGAQILNDATNAAWQGNILSGVDQATYNIKFYMTSDAPIAFSNMKTWADAKTAIAAQKTTVIAQSGVTGLAIQSLVIESIPSTNNVTRGVAATNLTMTIQEPMGVSFFDMMAQASIDLGIQNYTKCYYYIEVSFKGYDDSGNFVTNPCTSLPNGGTWLYQVGMKDVQVAANSAGSTYTMTFTPIEEDFFATLDLKLPFAFSPKGSTIGDMLNDLANQLNQNNLYMYAENTMTFKFKIAPFIMNGQTVDPMTWQISPQAITIDYADIRAMDMDVVEGVDKGSPIRAHFPMGMNITDVIEMLFVCSPDAQKYAKDIQQPDQIKKDDNSFRNSIIFRHEPSVDFGVYLPSVEQYTKNITITSLSYFTNKPIVDSSDIDNAKDANNQQKQAALYQSSGYMVKRYDYMFTGLNTEVLNFDFKFKMNWSAVLPAVLGLQGSNAAIVDQSKVRNDPQDLHALQNQLQTLTQQNQALSQKIAAAQSQVLNAQTAIDKATAAGATAQQLASAKANVQQAQSTLDAATAQRTSNLATIGKLVSQSQGMVAAANKLQVSPNPLTPALSYAEDELSNIGTIRQPISIKQAPNDFTHGGVPAQYTRDRSIYGAILDQVYGMMDNDLQKVTLSIRGDPYWLGAGNLERTVQRAINFSAPRNHTAQNVVSPQQVDYTFGDMMFLIAFKYPMGVNPDGSPMLKYNESFTGIYKVTQVTHTFEGGQFKQDLIGTRQPLSNAFQALNFAGSSQASGTGSSNPTTTTGLSSMASGLASGGMSSLTGVAGQALNGSVGNIAQQVASAAGVSSSLTKAVTSYGSNLFKAL